MSPGPRFLGIGAQKAATTWLEHCLRKHPAIWLPPRKELHYFDVRGNGWWMARRVFGPRSAVCRLRRELAPRLRADLRFLDRSGLRWDLRYFYLEDVRDQPAVLLEELFDFLGVARSVPVDADLLCRRVHVGRNRPEMPIALARELARLHLDTIRVVESRFGGAAVAWRRRAEKLVVG